jgi:hypothetical protein
LRRSTSTTIRRLRGIPNLLIIKGGQVKEQIIGAVPKVRLVQAVDSAIA